MNNFPASPSFEYVLSLFTNTADLQVRNEDEDLEKIVHNPTGWYFYTSNTSFISTFYNLYSGRKVNPSLLTCIRDQLISKSSMRIQKEVYEHRKTFV